MVCPYCSSGDTKEVFGDREYCNECGASWKPLDHQEEE